MSQVGQLSSDLSIESVPAVARAGMTKLNPQRFPMLQALDTASALLAAQVTEVPDLKRRKRPLLESSKAAYAKDIELFRRAGGTVPCDADAILRYVDVMRTRLAPATLYRRLAAIQHAHAAAGLPLPLADARVRLVIRWLQAGKVPPKSGKALMANPVPPKKPIARAARPVTRQLLERILDAVHRTSLDRRDRALLLLTFLGALKRTEVVSLNVEDLRWTSDALIVSLDRGDGSSGRRLAIPITNGELCAATALRTYIDHLQLEAGSPLFRSFNRAGEPAQKRLAAAFVSEVLKARMRVVGLDPTGYSGESLRVGRLGEIAKGHL